MKKMILMAAAVALLPLSTSLSQEENSGVTMSPEAGATPAKRKNDSSPLGALQKDRPKGAKTEIMSEQEATFDNETSVATFVGKVVVKDPQFNLFCDKLTVYLNKERKGIERAEAEGNVVIVQENENEKKEVVKSVGRGGKAIFTPDTGDVELRESPSIQQGINNHISTDPGTIMILNREGRLKTNGPSRTVIIDASTAGGL